jgi:hypothetical protein
VQDAQNYGSNPPFGTPRYIAANVVLGAHVTGVDEPDAAVCFRLGHRYHLDHLREGAPVVVEDDGSTLNVEAADDGNAPCAIKGTASSTTPGCWTGGDSSFHIRNGGNVAHRP